MYCKWEVIYYFILFVWNVLLVCLFQTELWVKKLFVCTNWNLFLHILNDILQRNLLNIWSECITMHRYRNYCTYVPVF